MSQWYLALLFRLKKIELLLILIIVPLLVVLGTFFLDTQNSFSSKILLNRPLGRFCLLSTMSVLQNFGGMAGSMDQQHVFRQAGLSWISSCHSAVVALRRRAGQGSEWQVIWCLGRLSYCITRLWYSDCLHPDRSLKTEIRTEKELKNKKQN